MKKLILTSILLIVVLATVSCAPKKQLYNIKPGGTSTDLIVDMHNCSIQAGLDEDGGFIWGPANYVAVMTVIKASQNKNKRKLYQECMEALGHVCVKNCPIKKTVVKHGDDQ